MLMMSRDSRWCSINTIPRSCSLWGGRWLEGIEGISRDMMDCLRRRRGEGRRRRDVMVVVVLGIMGTSIRTGTLMKRAAVGEGMTALKSTVNMKMMMNIANTMNTANMTINIIFTDSLFNLLLIFKKSTFWRRRRQH